jgi:DNA-binding transcriptional LysR family regulator
MQLSRIDLNLFTVFDAIYREGGITAAAKRLHLSQPAISHALGRLRELIGDPLFERHGNDMVPTPLARSLAATIGKSLATFEEVLQRAGHFDPATSQRRFIVALRNSFEGSLLPDLVAGLSRDAPGIDVAAVRIERRDLEEDLQSGELDIAMDVALTTSADVRRESLGAEPLVVLARRDHPRVAGALDAETYLALEHVLVTGRRRGGGYEDVALNRLGRERRIRVRCQRHTAACEVVAQSDLLVTMPRNQAVAVNRRANNQVLPFPIDVPAMEFFLYWHANVDGDAANRWFRERVSLLLKRYFAGERASESY